MDREQATEALKMLRRVVEQVRDDTALQNWGLIQIAHGLTNAIGFAITHWMFRNGWANVGAYVPVWGTVQGINIVIILWLTPRRGARSFVEKQIRAIWLTFLGAVIALTIVIDLMGLGIAHIGPCVALLFVVSFSSMAVVLARWFAVPAVLFATGAIAMAWIPLWQYVILGVLLSGHQLVTGALLHRQKLRQLAHASVGSVR